MYDIIRNSIIPWNTLCRLMLALSYWTLCLATGLFTNVQNMLELACCVKLHWSKRGVEKNVSTSDSCQFEACGGARTHGWPWIPGKTWEEWDRLSIEMTCTFLMMCFQNLPLVFKQSVCECVCLGEFCELPISYKSVQLDHTLARKNDSPTWCGVIVVVWCYCGGVVLLW